MNEQWLELQEKIDALSQRERVLLFAVVVAVIFFAVQMLLIDPLLEIGRAHV